MAVVGPVTVRQDLRSLFSSRGAEGFLHAVDLATGAEVGLDEEEPVVAASVFKIWVLLELCRQAFGGEGSLTERIRVASEDRVLGPTGLSVLLDEAELSVRDLAASMMSVSDNTATDVLMARVGLDRIQEGLRRLGLVNTILTGDCGDIFASIPEDVGRSIEELEDLQTVPEEMRRWRALDPQRTTRTTPRDTTALLRLIADDAAASPEVCAEVRRIMSKQIWPHRLRAGFPDEVRIWAKTGSLPGIRNEAGVVEYPDGGRYAVAVFTRSESLATINPGVDRAIWEAAALAVATLRSPGA